MKDWNLERIFYDEGPTGEEFEREMLSLIRQSMKKAGRESSFQDTTGTNLDKTQGTDAIVDGVPIDVTHNFSNKDNTEKRPETIKTGIKDIQFGIRTRNKRKRFEKPVLVIGTDMSPREERIYTGGIMDELESKRDELLDTIFDAYWNYMDETEDGEYGP